MQISFRLPTVLQRAAIGASFDGSLLKPGTGRNNGGTFRPVPPTKIWNGQLVHLVFDRILCSPLLFVSMQPGR